MNGVDSIMKTLYVTDLEGTLMRDDKTISEVSVAILNHLKEKHAISHLSHRKRSYSLFMRA